jgi:hypothetical protein
VTAEAGLNATLQVVGDRAVIAQRTSGGS